MDIQNFIKDLTPLNLEYFKNKNNFAEFDFEHYIGSLNLYKSFSSLVSVIYFSKIKILNKL
jgi:hypothetical protein